MVKLGDLEGFGLPSTIRTSDLCLRRAQAYFLQASLYGRFESSKRLQSKSRYRPEADGRYKAKRWGLARY